MDKKYVLTALGYAIVGLLLGIYMAASKNHGQLVAHAHIMLLGFVVSFIYAVIYKVWLLEHTSKLALPQYFCHQIGTVALVAPLLQTAFVQAGKCLLVMPSMLATAFFARSFIGGLILAIG